MQRFDCLSVDCPLWGPHLLEASAGTGKTFSIEHLFVRLILESCAEQPIELEQMLGVTFTKAATRELKARIRANLEKAFFLIQDATLSCPWDYLRPFQGKEEAKKRLMDAISAFDRCQIFTIHGFCYRMLKEYAFEANVSFSLPDPDQEKGIPKRLKTGSRDFLEWGLQAEILCPEQVAHLLKRYTSVEDLAERLWKREEKSGPLFTTLFALYQEALASWTGKSPEEEQLLADFAAVKGNYKSKGKQDFEAQIRAIAKSFQERENPLFFRTLLRHKATLFDFLHPRNKKVRCTEPSSLAYPFFFEWMQEHLAPLTEQAHQSLLQTLQGVWKPIADQIIAQEEMLTPDEILLQMQKAIQKPLFLEKVRQKYRVAIIDEFQDTDAVQWDIFQSLFVQAPLDALYLVGDPKQSIYRFRKADVYTYLQARDHLGENHLYHLDTNYRSSQPLIQALNALFACDWIKLPKANRVLPYLPVKAGKGALASLEDEKGSVHFLLGHGERLFDEIFLPYAASEIERLLPLVGQEGAFAVLVKDRYQAQKALSFLQRRGISAIARSQTALGETLAFQAIQELFTAVESPHDFSALQIVLAGPLGGFSDAFPAVEWKILLEEEGLVAFARKFFDFVVDGQTMRERIARIDLSFYRDMLQIFETLFLWERKEGFCFQGLHRYLSMLKELDPEEGGRRRMEGDAAAVQIMTMHISKGLEFDIVFALALATNTPEADEELEEIEAEKLRQLYVAMTRAKRRLYVPMALSEKESKEGTQSPMELFCKQFCKEKPLLEALEQLAAAHSVTYEEIQSSWPIAPTQNRHIQPSLEPFSFPSLAVTPFYLSSFTSLSRPQIDPAAKENGARLSSSEIQIHTMPKGAETGICIHRIFERLFSSQTAVWQDRKAIAALVEEELFFSPLAPWKEPILQRVYDLLQLPLQGDGQFFCLSSLAPSQVQVEMEFVFAIPDQYVKGFVDLVFCVDGIYYFLDWKTNWLGEEDSCYSQESLQKTMHEHDYYLQASLYAEALKRHLGKSRLGGAFYLFFRGNAPLYLPAETLDRFLRPDSQREKHFEGTFDDD